MQFQTTMRKLQRNSLWLVLLLSKNALATPPQYQEAIRKLQQAALKTAPVRASRKRLERAIRRRLDAPEWATTAVIIGAGAAHSGKLSTGKFKNLRLKGTNWKLKPDVEYRFDNGQIGTSLNFNLSF